MYDRWEVTKEVKPGLYVSVPVEPGPFAVGWLAGGFIKNTMAMIRDLREARAIRRGY